MVDITNVDILGAFEFVGHCGFTTDGKLVLGDISVSSGIGNVTYREILQQIQMNPFAVGLTYIYSLAGPADQVLQPFTVNTRDANGKLVSKAIIPLLDPMQTQAGVTIIRQVFRIDCVTKLTFANVLAGTIFQLQIFPVDYLNISRILVGAPLNKMFNSLQTVKGMSH